MAKTRKQTTSPEPPPMPQVGDKVKPGRSEMVYEISRVSQDGQDVDLYFPELTFSGSASGSKPSPSLSASRRRRPPTRSRPPGPTLDADEVLGRIGVVQQEILKRLDDDIDILKAYLKTQGAPKATISTLEGLRNEQHEGCKVAIERIEELLEE
jgi:hypothetical protein